MASKMERHKELSSEGLGIRQFKAVMKKNLLLKRRKPFETALEILSPMMFCLVIVFFFSISGVTKHDTTVYASRFLNVESLSRVIKETMDRDEPMTDEDTLSLFYKVNDLLTDEGFKFIPTLDEYVYLHRVGVNMIGKDDLNKAGSLLEKLGGVGHYWINLFLLGNVIISPDTPQTRQFREWLRNTYKHWEYVEGPMFDTLQEAEQYALNPSRNDSTWAHLHFDSLDFDSSDFEVRIRMKHTTVPHTTSLLKEFTRGVGHGSNKYFWSGFLTLQRAVEYYVTNRTHTITSGKDATETANKIIGHAFGVDNAIGNSKQLYSGIWNNRYVESIVPTGMIQNVTEQDLLQMILKLSGMEKEYDAYKQFSEELPESPWSYSLADDWSAPFPTRAWELSNFYDQFGYITGLVLSCAVIYPLSQLILVIVQEKEIRMKEMMRMMGLREWVFHATWLLTYGVLFLIQAFVQTLYLCTNVFNKSSFSLILLFAFLFNMTLISLAFMVAAFFNRAKLASMIGPIIVFSMVIPAYVFTFYPSYEFVLTRKVLSLLSPTAFSFGIDRIITYERNNVGLTWDNMHMGSVPFSFTLGMMFFDFLLYGFLAWYFDKVVPTKYGTSRSPWFIFKPSFWSDVCSAWYKRLFTSRSGAHGSNSNDEDDEEAPPENIVNGEPNIAPLQKIGKKGSIERQIHKVDHWNSTLPSVELKNLTKKYHSSKKIAVNSVNMEMMHGELTCILGANGAGKSTLYSMLTGLFDVTSGDATIYGESIVRNIDAARKMMGVCPQYDVIYPDLTVREHLEFFAVLKGMKPEYLHKEVNEIIQQLELSDKSHAPTKTLSGGQKRKLSLGMALIAHSKVVFLDEPSSGMCVQNRRLVWDLILQSKEERTIILTTHHLEEAEILGDRICIMKDGDIVCAGDPLELKTTHGLGYVLTMTKSDLSKSDISGIKELVQSNVPKAILMTNSAGEVSFQLPSDNNKQLAKLFEELEHKSKELNVENYGIGMTTLEDVFLSVIEKCEGERGDSISVFNKHTHSQNSNQALWERSVGDVSYWNQFKAIMRKRYLVLRRDRGSIFHELVMPLLVVSSVLFVLSITPESVGPPLLLLSRDTSQGFDRKVVLNGMGGEANAFPKMFEFRRGAGARLNSPYFPDDMKTYDTDCASSICLSYRKLANIEMLEDENSFNGIDRERNIVDLCSYRYDDFAFIKLNIGELAGLVGLDLDGIKTELASTFNVDPSEIDNVRFDEILDRALTDVLETEISVEMLLELSQGETDNSGSPLTGLREALKFQLRKTFLYDPKTGEYTNRVNEIVGSTLEVLFDSNLFDNIALKQDSKTGSTFVGRTRGFVPSLFAENVINMNGFLQVFIDAVSAQNGDFQRKTDGTNTENVDNTLDSVRKQNSTSQFNDMKLSDIKLETFIEQLGLAGYYKEQACHSTLTMDDLQSSYDLDETKYDYDPNALNQRGELCRLAQKNLDIAIAVVTLETERELGQTVGSKSKPPTYLSDVFDWIDPNTTFGALLDASKMFNGLTKLFEDNTFSWNRVKPSIFSNKITLSQALFAMNIDVVPALKGALLQNPIFAVIGGLTLGTILGRDDLNLSIPIERSTLFSPSSDHSKAVCMADLTHYEVRARAKIQQGENRGGFRVWSHPFPTTNKDVKQIIWLAFFAVLFTLVPFCYNPACYGLHAVQERVSSAKHLLFASGMGFKVYWLANFAFDYLSYLIVAVWTMLVFTISGAIEFGDQQSAIAFGTICLFLLYGLASIPQAYCLSFLFKDSATAQIVISLFNFFTGWMFVVVAVSFDIYGMTEESEMVRKLFRIFPAYNLGEGLIAATRESITSKILERNEEIDIMKWDIMGRNIIVMIILAWLYFSLLVFIEYMAGNVRMNYTIEKLARSLTKFRRGRQAKSSVMPVTLQKSGKDPSDLSSAKPSDSFTFSDDEGDDDQDDSAANKSSKDLAASLYKSDKTNDTPILEEDLSDKSSEEIIKEGESYAKVGNGVLRKFDAGQGYEYEPSYKKGSSKRHSGTYVFDEDEDVRGERRRVLNNGCDDILKLVNVRKVYAGLISGKKHVAVRQLCLGIPKGQCFGFLGTNGAGKTTTMKMITKDVFPSEGKVLLENRSIFSYGSSRDIGYCPQFDTCLFPRLTAREHLYIYAAVKGVTMNIEANVDRLLEACDLVPHADQYASSYSGGTRRKLSIAIALMGNPKVVLFDEPSAGVCPYARRKIWEIISASLHDGRSMVLTTHSMDEAEALCDRLGIMANGVLRCIGTPLHLKSRFGSGYEVEIRTNTKQECQLAIGYLQDQLSASLKECFGVQAKLSISKKTHSLSSIFHILERNRKTWKIKSYGVTQGSIEQVFVQIANKYNPRRFPKRKPTVSKNNDRASNKLLQALNR